MEIPKAIITHMKKYSEHLRRYPKLRKMYESCYLSTIRTALRQMDGSYFVLTGDIPAMWLRDSTAEVVIYLDAAKESDEVRDIIKGVIDRQMDYILIDPYANAFNEDNNGKHGMNDIPKPSGWVWERKYEVDSLCYPLQLVYKYVKATGDISVIDEKFKETVKLILHVWQTEQYHEEKSGYYFIRRNAPTSDTLPHKGKGNPVAYTGMTWSGFRPSDDACRYGYLVPSNMFAAVTLKYAAELLDGDISEKCTVLAGEIRNGIEEYAIINHSKYGKMYVCETDGYGNYELFDDANIPSLLSIPYIGFAEIDDKIYQNTRRFILSEDNPYYFRGNDVSGVGSPHTPDGYIWHMALCMQALTSQNAREIRNIINMLENTDNDTLRMHESFDKDNPSKYTRLWFCWADSLFAETVEMAVQKGII
ncbi:MAG: glycoside hydrolase family 125 protein [Clostridia bacterium]|nr:glycoside hydrolase family 125 protein [Clostridia bacterium]